MTRSELLAAILVLAAAAGCKDDGVAALETTRDRVCDCKTAACVDTAMDQLVDRPTDHQHKAEAVAREITECVVRIYSSSDAEPPAIDAGPADAGPADAGPTDAAPVTPP